MTTAPSALSETPAPPAGGLSGEEAKRRLAEQGPNEIDREKGASPWAILAAQFKGAMIWLLLGACVVSAVLGEVADAIAIGAIVVLNALVGFFQEYRAERAVQALRSMTAPRARVLRDGASVMIPATDVVVGDALVLEAGDIVPADARLRLADALRVNEVPLTGESAPAQKRIASVAADAHLAERTDCVFMGTSVSAGTGSAEVIATGMGTELGKIAHLLAAVKQEATPLQRRLESVGKTLLGGLEAREGVPSERKDPSARSSSTSNSPDACVPRHVESFSEQKVPMRPDRVTGSNGRIGNAVMWRLAGCGMGSARSVTITGRTSPRASGPGRSLTVKVTSKDRRRRRE